MTMWKECGWDRLDAWRKFDFRRGCPECVDCAAEVSDEN